MDGGETGIDTTERCDEVLIRTIIDVYQTEVIILPIQAPSPRMIVVLEPVAPDDLWLLHEPLHRRRCATCAIRLGLHRHQVPVIAVPSTIFVGGKKPLGDQDGFIARELPEAIKVVPGDPAVWAVDVVVGGHDVDVWYHGAHGL